MPHILLGVTGSIAAYKAVDLASKLRQAGVELTTLMTESATRFVAPLSFESVSGGPVHVGMFDELVIYRPKHIDLTEEKDLFLVAPATANVLAKLAHGIADDLLSTAAISVTCPIWAAPTMSDTMFANAAVQANLKILRERGVRLLEPGEGHLACGRVGPGRMMEPSDILEEVLKHLERTKVAASSPRPSSRPRPRRKA